MIKSYIKKIAVSLCIVFLISIALMYHFAHADINNNLILWYTFDNNKISGTSYTDSSGQGNTGTSSGSPGVAPGPRGQSMYCNNSGYIADSSLTGIATDAHVTFAMWFRRPTVGSLIQIQQGTNSNTGLFGPTIYSDGNIYFDMDGPVNNQYGEIATNDTNWHFYVMIYDGTQSTNATKMVIYLDNVKQSPSYNNTIPTTVPTLAGGFQVCKATAGGALSTGYVDDLRMYSITFTAAQEAALYAQGKNQNYSNF